MKIYAPNYYGEFCCIADKCRHNCCIGWEIDIDSDTYEYYQTVGGSMGRRLADNIHSVDEVPCFRLGEDERCPFLNNKNLCDIISQLGEDKLCEICTDHPRYRNYYSSRTETGLGLCCEEAARIILTSEDKMRLTIIGEDDDIAIDDEEENAFFSFRQRAFDIMQDRSKTISERISRLCSDFDIIIPKKSGQEWSDLFRALERLDEEWDMKLEMLRKTSPTTPDSLENSPIPAEQLMIYFLYRHMTEGIYDGKMPQRMAFAIVSCCIIFAIADGICSGDAETLADVARMYSAEIEYSDENINKILEVL